MDDGSRLPWVIALILLACAAYFAAAETAFASCSRTKIKAADERGDVRAKEALFVLDNFDRAISTLLICTNVVHISIATIVTVEVMRIWRSSGAAVSISTLLTTLVVFFAGEMLPKSMAKKNSEKYSLRCGGLISFLMKLLKPLSTVLTVIGHTAAKFTRGDPQITVTEDELYDIIEDMTEEGSLDEQQGDLISSALQFGEVTVESVLTPRVDIAAINVEDGLDSILSQIKSQNHSRLPVYRDSIDNIIGVLQIRKFIKAYLKLGKGLDIEPLLDEVFFVHQSTNIDELLPVMSKRKINVAVVTDNFGGTVGIVTVEDILEELVGEIWDEDDVVKEQIVPLGGGLYTVDAEESVSDVLEQLGVEDPEENGELVNTLMGEWAYEQFTAIPKPGDSFNYHGVQVTVSEMEHNRILKLKVEVLPDAQEGGDKQ